MGFAIPTPLLPIVCDFHSWSSRIAVLIPGHIDGHCLLSMHPPQYKINAWISNGNMNSGNKYTQSSIVTNRSSPLSYGGLQYSTLSQSDLRIGITYRSLHLFFLYSMEDDLLPSANLSFMIDFLQDNELSIVSSMRPRPSSQIITSLEISESPPPYTAPATASYATLDRILCRIEHQKLFRSICSSPCHITLVPSPFPPLREHPVTIFSLSKI